MLKFGIECGDWMNNGLPDGCVNLLIADPPYFEVKGDFDFRYASFDEYLKIVDRWAQECKRLLAANGTLVWYGSAKKIAYTQIIFDKYFELINSVVWDKGKFMNLEYSSEIRSFAPCTERILIYSNDTENLNKSLCLVRDYVRSGITAKHGTVCFKDVNAALGSATNGGGIASTCLSLNKVTPGMLTKEMYEKLQDWCSPHLSRPYEDLRRIYEDLRRPYNNEFKLQEVLRFGNEQAKGELYDHPTVKPESLTRSIIITLSNPGDYIYIPFAGSGTECAMALKEGRNFYAHEFDKKYYDIAVKRIVKMADSPTLF